MGTNEKEALGPEIEGTRITVYTLLPHLLDSSATEAYICKLYDLSPEQVAAARAYALRNAGIVLNGHIEIEERLASGNPQDLIDEAEKTRHKLLSFKEWLAERENAESAGHGPEATLSGDRTTSGSFPTFKQWLAERESRPNEAS